MSVVGLHALVVSSFVPVLSCCSYVPISCSPSSWLLPCIDFIFVVPDVPALSSASPLLYSTLSSYWSLLSSSSSSSSSSSRLALFSHNSASPLSDTLTLIQHSHSSSSSSSSSTASWHTSHDTPCHCEHHKQALNGSAWSSWGIHPFEASQRSHVRRILAR